MSLEDFSQLDSLSYKALSDTLTFSELDEFNELLSTWNEYAELKFLNGS